MEHAAVPSMSREQILETWVHTYAGAILKTCFIYLADHDLAQDAMQHTPPVSGRSPEALCCYYTP